MARRSTILGRAKLQRKLDRLPVVTKTTIKNAMAAQADEIVTMAKRLAPYNSVRETIGWTWGRNVPKGAMIAATVKAALGSDLVITIYAGSDAVFWTRWVEFGTAPHSTARGGGTKRGQAAFAETGGGHPGTAAHPFFYVSYRANRKKAKRAITRAVRDAARQVARG